MGEIAHITVSGDLEGEFVVTEERGKDEFVITREPDTSAKAIRKRLGTEPATLAEFEAEFGTVRPPDGKG